MFKLNAFFLVLWICSGFLSGIMEGGNGFASTQLDGATTDVAVLINVDSIDGFLPSDYIVVDEEEMFYDSVHNPDGHSAKPHFNINVAGRGYNGTTAVAHSDNAVVYTADASTLNNAMGFNINASRDAYGAAAIITVPIQFFTKTIPNIVMLNFSFLTGELALLGWIFFGLGIAYVVTLALAILGGVRT